MFHIIFSLHVETHNSRLKYPSVLRSMSYVNNISLKEVTYIDE